MEHKVLLLRDVDPDGKKYLENHNCRLFISRAKSEQEFVRDIHNFQPEAIFVRSNMVTADMIDASSVLKVIAKHGVGYDNVDVRHALRRNIQVVYVPEGNYVSVAEHAMFLIMACAKRYRTLEKEMEKGNFAVRSSAMKAIELEGKVLGIVGCGHIGRKLAQIASGGFGMSVIGWSRHLVPETVTEEKIVGKSREDILKEADFLVLCVPSSPETRHSFTYEEFRKMKRSAMLINVARGDIVKEADLIRALKEELIQGAGLDVFDPEPPSVDNPLLSMENVVATPHFAAFTPDAFRRTSMEGAKQIIDVLEGRKPAWPVKEAVKGN